MLVADRATVGVDHRGDAATDVVAVAHGGAERVRRLDHPTDDVVREVRLTAGRVDRTGQPAGVSYSNRQVSPADGEGDEVAEDVVLVALLAPGRATRAV